MNLTLQRAGRCAVAALVALAALGAPSATAAGLPSPAPTVGVAAPLPSPSLPGLPLPTPSASPALPVTTAPSAVGSILGSGESAAGATAGPAPAAPEHPIYQPSPDEQSSLPDEPGRLAYEQQQLDVTTDFAAFDATLGGIAIGAGGGSGRFGWPVVVPGGQKAPITQRFGCTNLPGEPYKAECPSKRWHSGLDLAEPTTFVLKADSSGGLNVTFPAPLIITSQSAIISRASSSDIT